MRVLITGASGFAGSWLVRACAADGDEIIGASRSGTVPDGCGRGVRLDLRDAAAVQRLFTEVQPQVVYHLAALSHVGRSWEDPATTITDNAASAVAVLEAARRALPETRIVWASSCEVYGAPAQLPLTEDSPLAPVNPYAVSKAAGDLLAGVYADAHGIPISRARAFNHAGPGQLPLFIVSSLAQQAAQARLRHATSVQIVTGNPDARRDFTDVRDVVRAYRLLAGADVPPGVYNICSGVSVSAAEHVRAVASLLAPIEVEHVVDPARVRTHEVMDHRGSYDRLASVTGWRPAIPLRQTLVDTIAWWESELNQDS
ncbi:MAG: GDP-mannose 4,6-dehydratase [Solirubrobacteraceae bacterium]